MGHSECQRQKKRVDGAPQDEVDELHRMLAFGSEALNSTDIFNHGDSQKVESL